MLRKRNLISSAACALLLMSSCQKDEISHATSEDISRYDGITADKIIPSSDTYAPILHDDGWEQPRPIAGLVNSAGLEDSPFIAPDGNTLFFFYTPSAERDAYEQVLDGITGIYHSQVINGEWNEPERVLLVEKGDAALDGCPFIMDSNLWFCSIRAGNYRDIDIWLAEWDGSNWSEIRNAGEVLNTEYQIGEMHLAPGGKTLYFHAPRGGENVDYDLYSSVLINGSWQDPTPITALNTEFDDSRPALSPDGQELWFTRTYEGTPAIFRSRWSGTEWGEAELILSQFAGEPSIDAQGNIYFTHHFFQNDKMIEADIYVAKKKK